MVDTPQSEPLRIAMWSGPRNISTAMMYSFANRGDTFATDEPLYAHYLSATGIDHPSAAEVIENGLTDWRSVVKQLCAEVPDGSRIWYQKHMCHHIIEGMEIDWLSSFKNCFLIRDPREVLLSLSKRTDAIDAWATGLPQQARIFKAVREMTGENPLVVDSGDILNDPAGVLRSICEHLEIAFDSRMLDWQSGPKECDGIWAEHWYDAVWASTGFAAPRPREGELSKVLQFVLDEVQPIYNELASHRMT